LVPFVEPVDILPEPYIEPIHLRKQDRN